MNRANILEALMRRPEQNEPQAAVLHQESLADGHPFRVTWKTISLLQ